MVCELLDKTARQFPDKPFVIDRDVTITYAQMAAWARQEAERLNAGGHCRYALTMRDSAALIAGLLASDLLGGETMVINRAYEAGEVKRLAERFDFQWVMADTDLSSVGVQTLTPGPSPPPNPQFWGNKVGEGSDPHPDPPPRTGEGTFTSRSGPSPAERSEGIQGEGSGVRARLIVLTTGTTGDPKGAVYRWDDLLAQIQARDSHADSRFLLAYPLNHFAGIQILLHVVRNGATLVIPKSTQMADVADACKQHGVDRISATATFWRFFAGYFGGKPPEGIALRGITIGGEATTGPLLSQLAEMFPGVPVSQVYAATEIGSCFSVRDKQKGFPASWLEDPNRDPQLKIEDGELYVKSKNSMLRYYEDKDEIQGAWYATGDVVRVEEDRVVFLGRKSEVIKVGGVKVHPAEVEDVIQRVPGVKIVRVYGKSNPITGHIVAADVVPEGDLEADALKKAIQQACAESLTRYQQPRLIQIVASLPVANQKVLRRTNEP